MKRFFAIIIFALCCSMGVMAQANWEYELKAGLAIGGNAPLPIPIQIRSVSGYKFLFNPSLGIDATWWHGKFGILSGIRFEKEGMKTDAQVKSYYMELVMDDGGVLGYYTGNNHSEFEGYYATVPLYANYRIKNRAKVRAGLFLSYLIDASFEGYVSDGYLRSGSFTGEKVIFDGDSKGIYDFSSNINSWKAGLGFGGSWLVNNRISANADLYWGLTDTFEKDFDVISFKMYPIYAKLSIGYLLF